MYKLERYKVYDSKVYIFSNELKIKVVIVQFSLLISDC